MQGDFQRILIIKQSSLGDIVHTLPVAHALKRCWPQVQIGWIVEQAFASLLARDPAVDAIYPLHIPSTSSPGAPASTYWQALTATWDSWRKLRRSFRAAPYDLTLDLHASFRSGLLALANPGGRRIGFAGAREGNSFFQHQRLRVPEGMEHAVDKNLLFSAILGCPAKDEDFHLCANQNDAAASQAFLEDSGIADQAFVYINPAARWNSKFWPSEHWSELCDRLLDTGIRVVFGGSPSEQTYIRKITSQMRHRSSQSGAQPAHQPAIAAGRLSLTESIALMHRASAYVGLDTGPMHMAAMVGIPVVALFGPTHPERVGPYKTKHAVLQAKGLGCLRCRKRDCDHLSCMRGISVDAVYTQVIEFCTLRANSNTAPSGARLV